jgi:hypothetical protein
VAFGACFLDSECKGLFKFDSDGNLSIHVLSLLIVSFLK